MDQELLLGRPWCARVELIDHHCQDGSYWVNIQDPITGKTSSAMLGGTGPLPPRARTQPSSLTLEESRVKTSEALAARMVDLRIKAGNRDEHVPAVMPVTEKLPTLKLADVGRMMRFIVSSDYPCDKEELEKFYAYAHSHPDKSATISYEEPRVVESDETPRSYFLSL
jgi:hypothetical protein